MRKLKNSWLLSISALFLFACANEAEQQETEAKTDKVTMEAPAIEVSEPEASTVEFEPFYIINTAAVKTEVQAKEKVRELQKEGYEADYLWIPDYESLSGAEYFSVFIGPFKTKQECAIAVDQYQITNPKAYGTLVSHDPERVVVGGLNQATE